MRIENSAKRQNYFTRKVSHVESRSYSNRWSPLKNLALNHAATQTEGLPFSLNVLIGGEGSGDEGARSGCTPMPV